MSAFSEARKDPITSASRRMFQTLDWWRLSLVDLVRGDRPDLSARQLALLLSVYMTAGPHTIKSSAELLKVSKPAVTRAVDRLEELGLLKRKQDEKDKRTVILHRTVQGSVFLADFSDLIQNAAHNTVIPSA